MATKGGKPSQGEGKKPAAQDQFKLTLRKETIKDLEALLKRAAAADSVHVCVA